MEAERVAASVCLVVPCYNERARLAVDEIGALAADSRVSLVLVDDGSTDGTLDLLRAIERDTSRVTVIALPRNRGKGEAVRAGLISASAANPAWLGYLDADMATPASEILRLMDVAVGKPCVDVVLGSRVALLGRDVQPAVILLSVVAHTWQLGRRFHGSRSRDHALTASSHISRRERRIAIPAARPGTATPIATVSRPIPSNSKATNDVTDTANTPTTMPIATRSSNLSRSLIHAVRP